MHLSKISFLKSFLAIAFIISFMSFFVHKEAKAELIYNGQFPGVQVSTGGTEGEPCSNREGDNTYDAASMEDCGGGGGSTPKPEYPIITTQMAVDSVTVFVLNQSGYIKSQKSSCVIEDGKNNCNVLFDWETFSPVGTSSVTRNPEAGFTIQNANTGTGVSLPVYYGTSRYFLYNNSQKLDETSVDASCATGSSWVASIAQCVKNVSIKKFSTPNCLIDLGKSTCNSEISWEVTGGYGDFSITTPVNITVAIGRLGTKSYPISYPSKSFDLKNNDSKLATSIAYADCKNPNVWDGSVNMCVMPTTPQLITGSISATNCAIAQDGNSCNTQVSWDSQGVTNPIVKQNSVQIANTHSGVTTRSIPQGITNFSISDGMIALNSTSATASCDSGTTWDKNENKCVVTIDPRCPNGALNYPECTFDVSFEVSNCEIPLGKDSCESNLAWSTSLLGSFAITTPENITVSSLKTGDTKYKVEYPLRIFFAYNNGNLVSQKIAYAVCEQGEIKGIWNTELKKCLPEAVASCPEPLTREVSVACDKNAQGQEAISGSVTRLQVKEYPACTFYEPVTESNSIYLGDNCKYPGSGEGEGEGENVDPMWGPEICGQCSTGDTVTECRKVCDHSISSGKYCPGDASDGSLDGVMGPYPKLCSAINNPGSQLNIVFSITPNQVMKGRPATLRWVSSANTCEPDPAYEYFVTENKPSGSIIVSPDKKSTYGIICEKNGIVERAQVEIKVNTINIIEA